MDKWLEMETYVDKGAIQVLTCQVIQKSFSKLITGHLVWMFLKAQLYK